jgi:hypothetical protein
MSVAIAEEVQNTIAAAVVPIKYVFIIILLEKNPDCVSDVPEPLCPDYTKTVQRYPRAVCGLTMQDGFWLSRLYSFSWLIALAAGRFINMFLTSEKHGKNNEQLSIIRNENASSGDSWSSAGRFFSPVDAARGAISGDLGLGAESD